MIYPMAYGDDLGYVGDVAFVFTCMARVSLLNKKFEDVVEETSRLCHRVVLGDCTLH